MPMALEAGATPVDDIGARVAVIDIGSNSIRLVVYDGLKRAPLPVLNEKVQCALGKGLSRSGRLNPEGVAMALTNLQRFRHLAYGLGAVRVDVLATAAVREAADGESFIRQVEQLTGLTITIVPGEEEARLAAMGVLSGSPGVDGLIGDMGGGSVELVGVETGTIQQQVTLPLGPFRLAAIGNPRQEEVVRHVDEHLEALSWLGRMRGRDFIPVGGSWRAIARLHMEQTEHPIHIIHHYTMETETAIAFSGWLARANRTTLERLAGVARRRETIQHAALVFERLLLAVEPAQVVFSAYGLREGHLFSQLSEAERAADPLLAACRDLASRMGRAEGCELMIPWTDGLLAGESDQDRRLREAACLLSEIAWAEHPDYRAEHALIRVLRFPFPGIDHAGRVFLALTMHARYASNLNSDRIDGVRAVLPYHQVTKALVLGLALRLAHTVSGGAPQLLARTALTCDDEAVTLHLPADLASLNGDVVERRVKALAQAMDRTPKVTATGIRA